MLKLSIKMFRSFCRQKTGSFFLIFIGMFVSILGVMFVYSRGKMVYETNASYNCETSTVKMSMETDTSTSLKLYSLLLNNSCLPEIHQLTAFHAETATVGHYNNGELRLTIPFGHYFTAEEISSGKVVLLSDAYLAQAETSFIENMIGSSIELNGHNSYTVIGRYNSTLYGDQLYSQEVIIPLHTYIEDGFPLENLEIIFSTAPGKEQLSCLESIFKDLNITYSLDPPKSIESLALKSLAKETLSHFIVLLICYVTLLNLLRYWIKANLRKFYIYFMCGCSSHKLIFLLLANTSYLYIIAAFFSLFVFKLLEPYFYMYDFISSLRVFDYLCIYLVSFVCALATTLLVTVRQLNKFTTIKEIIF